MKFFFNLLVLILAHVAKAQNADEVDTITFSYAIGGTFSPSISSRNEELEFVRLKTGDFILSHQLQYNQVNRKNGYINDTIRNKKWNSIIPKTTIQNLLNALNKNEKNYTGEFIKPLLTKPTKNEILRIIKKNKQDWQLTNEYTDREERTEMYKNVQELKYFDEYINLNMPDSLRTFYIDAWHGLIIKIHSKNETIAYGLEFFKNCGQPVHTFYSRVGIINLNVNVDIQKMLPEGSRIFNAVDLNNLKEGYINWYIKTKS